MLKEDPSLSDNSQWKKVKSSFHKDRRYKAIESSSRREELFTEYIKCLNRVSEGIFSFQNLANLAILESFAKIRPTILSRYTCKHVCKFAK